MLVQSLSELYTRDLNKLISEIEACKDEDKLWVTEKAIPNSAGNLAMHLVGNLKTYIGLGLTRVSYERNREFEFTGKHVPRTELITQINETILLVQQGLLNLSDADLEKEYPYPVWETPKQTGYTLFHLLAHLNYHLGQVNYHRRLLDK